jgi:hypothetical protein
MNIRAKAEQEILKNCNSQTSLQELYLLSPASKQQTNHILAEMLNHKAINIKSGSCQIAA